IAAALVQSTGSTYSVTVYLCVATAVGFLAAASLQDRTGVPLDTD
ncbi:MAG: MHS family MFS transporter, partial [Corynebacterium marinum]|nr:MHS family MFS transporter [Corynebacterium marinum]